MATKKAATEKKTATEDAATKEASRSMPKAGKDPKGGLTAAGRKFFNETQGSHLRPGVDGPADTPEKKKRKGSFLTRHFTHPRGPMEKDGEPTRLALSAQAWGETMPKTEAAAKKLAAKGRKLLADFHKEKESEGSRPAATKVAAGRGRGLGSSAKKAAGKKAVASKGARGKGVSH